ncbi:tripartite tricarboxylate transporter substrate binding protein [Variovorax sp. KK3]|uniref:Bug family tripartite tricarboxylate transporter substrate binding protein n=1 Tax=Variovorax sp. KK3 TaxID=1855728 RepID=UPI00097BFBBB|nr:tripartite tricarboxylate transporter substrate binding protein [Variovorax sp. KK3]
MNTRNIVATAVTLAALAFAPVVRAQAPAGLTTGPVRITSTLPAGSGPDTIARVVAEKLQAKWERPVVVDPKPGGAGVVAINAMKNAPPTGNDLVVADVGNLSINPLIFKKLSYDPDKELVPVAVLYKTAFFVTVGADSPFKTLKDLLQAANGKTRPLSYGSNAVGGPIHLFSARLEHAVGANMMHVPYKETSQLYAAVSTGEVDWAYGSIATAGPLARAGKLRFLAVADVARSPALPDVPTLEEAGGPQGISTLSWVALMAPRGTPAGTVDGINKAVNEALSHPDARDRLNTFGFIASPGPAQQVADLMKSDRARYAEVLRHVKVSID